MATQQEHDQAKLRGEQMLPTEPRALSARFDEHLRQIIIELSTGYSIVFSPQRAQGLENASDGELRAIEISFPGFGVRFPGVDADLWVPGLAVGRFGSVRWEADWVAAHPIHQAT